jgi:hypothetical protein
MSQQIQASIPSPVSPAVAPQVTSDQGSTAYPQWVAQTSTPAVASVPTAQPPSQATPASVPSTSNQYSQLTSQSSPSNPWEAAMGSLERVLSQVNSQSLSQAPQSPSMAQMQPAIQPNSQPSQVQPWAYQAQQAAPTSYTSASPTQASYPVSTEQSSGLEGISEATQQVVSHFGIEAPGILNQYACALEDMLIEQATQLDDVSGRHNAMQTILTNPDVLADYTDRFFTEVVPVDIDSDVPAMNPQAPQAYQPNYDMPAPPASAGGRATGGAPQQAWEQFSDVMNRSPENAWRVLQQMGPEAMRSKLLFMDPA